MSHTPEQLQAAREYAADVERRLIADLKSGAVQCHNPQAWIDELEKMVERIVAGHDDSNFTIWQRMHYFLTGECRPLLAA